MSVVSVVACDTYQLDAVRQAVPDYADWMVAVNYEVEAWQPPQPRRTRRGA